MTEQLNGLRFDIYERVYLADGLAAIEELEEIELVPHMQALPQEDQVLLRGHLLLSGIYRSQGAEGDEGVSQLEHWIPIEISLPLNRIQNVGELAVEIDNFDVDLLSNRSLNVTGVLALRGLQAHDSPPVWRDDSFTVVHQAYPEQQSSEIGSHGNLVNSAHSSQDAVPEGLEDWSLQSAVEESTAVSSKQSSWITMFENSVESRDGPVELMELEELKEPEDELEEVKDFSESISGDEVDLKENQWDEPEADRVEAPQDVNPIPGTQEYPHSPQSNLEGVEGLEELQNLKVALNSHPQESVHAYQFGVGLLSQLGEKGAKREAELKQLEAAKAEEKVLADSQATDRTEDELEWTRLFLINGSENHSFRKVKLCIVQKEETLDLIANRYNVQPRELQLYNRLHDPYLSEGQVIYIP